MAKFQYYCGGKLHSLSAQPLDGVSIAGPKAGRGPRGFKSGKPAVGDAIKTLHAQSKRLATRFHEIRETRLMSATVKDSGALVIPTESLIVEGVNKADRKWLRDKFGMEEVQEGRHGKVLLRAPEAGESGIRMVFDAAQQVFKRGKPRAAHPNFLRAVQRPAPSSSGSKLPWNIDNNGNPGIPGADVHGEAAWTISTGEPSVRVAVLDEGVDTLHSRLSHAVVDQADFVDENSHARPDGDDAHGTACAGIIVSNDAEHAGLATDVSLVAVRIAKSDANGFWIFDDFDTADAIDWAWDDAQSDVLSNSWGGGFPTDVIINAFERARKQGRNGKGAVVVIAAGNDQAPVDFPGNLPNVLTVGASNQWDERKTTTSKDKETWWGSNYGDSLDLLAPGVKIKTTDIRGDAGYSNTLFTDRFNGTSSATPHVAAAAALVLSVNPDLTEDQVRSIITSTTDPLSGGEYWNRYEGYGRLNAYAAVWRARRTEGS